jgi:hypothetical protein
MNVNLWGPHLWTVLHGLAALQTRPADMETVLKGLCVLLPCSLCQNSYCSFYKTKKNVRGMCERGEGPKLVWQIHNLVNDKLEAQRLEKFMDALGAHGNQREAMIAMKGLLSNRPSFDVVMKRAALASTQLQYIHTDDIFRVLFAFVLNSGNDPIKYEWIAKWIQALTNMYPVKELERVYLPQDRKEAFASLLMARDGIRVSASSFARLATKYREDIDRVFSVYVDELTAGSCRYN